MKKRLKILYIITQGTWGGAQRYVFDLATAYASNHDVTVAVGEPNGAHDLQERLATHPNIRVMQLRHLVRPILPWRDIKAISEIRTLIKTLSPDIIHLNSTKAGIIGSLSRSKLQTTNCKLLYTAHGWVFNEPLSAPLQYIYKILEKSTARRKDGIVTLSKADTGTARDTLGIPESKIRCIPLGIDMNESILSAAAARTELNPHLSQAGQSAPTIIGVIANFYKTKGVDLLLHALSTIKNDLNKCQVAIIGSGPDKDNLLALSKKYGLDNYVSWCGSIPNAARLLPACEVVVIPSRKEGLPYTLLEAGRAGVPVIASAVGAIPEVISDSKTGWLVTTGDTSALASAISTALSNRLQTKMIGTAAKEHIIRTFDLPTMVANTLTFYQE